MLSKGLDQGVEKLFPTDVVILSSEVEHPWRIRSVKTGSGIEQGAQKVMDYLTYYNY